MQKKDSILFYLNQGYTEAHSANYKYGLAVALTHKAGFALCLQDNFPRAEQLACEALYWFNRSSAKKGITLAYQILGRTQTNQCRYDEAISNLKQSLEWARKTSDSDWVGSNLETMTDIYRERGEYVNLLTTQEKLIQMDRASGNHDDYSFHELWVLGLMYRLLEDYTTALPFWRKLFVESKNGFLTAWNQMEYAELLTLAGRTDSALYYYNQFDSVKADRKDLRFFLVSKGEYFLHQQQYSTALPYFRNGLQIHRQFNDNRQINRTILDLAKTYTALHRTDSALVYVREGLTMALQTRAKPLIRDAYAILYAVYDRLQQKDSAYTYYRNYISTKEAVMNDQTRGKMAAYNYEHQIEMLAKQKQIQQQQITQAALQKKLLVLGIGSLLLLGVILLRNILLKRKNEISRRKLAEQQLHLQQLQSERAQAEFQKNTTELKMQALRAQMNPHFIFNSLNSINHFILNNERLQASAYLTKFSRLVRLILQNSQAALIPLENELEALRLYLELEALRFNQHFRYRITVAKDVDVTTLKVPPLLIQPYVENAIWHGLMHKKEKGLLTIDIAQKEQIIWCRIRDDGVGRKKAAMLKQQSIPSYQSLGLQITADRIAMLKHHPRNKTSVTIHDLVLPDGSPRGTEVILKIPRQHA